MKIVGVHKIKSQQYQFTIWAPHAKCVELKIVSPREMLVMMDKDTEGYWSVTLGRLSKETKYSYRIDKDATYPDPASHYQPEGVFSTSQIIDHSNFKWTDEGFHPCSQKEMILYELHIGTFTPEGTFESAINYLDDLVDLGINTIQLMPIMQTPGERNWGYDVIFFFAVQYAYGGPQGLKKFIDACHSKKLTVILDVVYNHIGPEGNCLENFAPYFSKKHQTPWGKSFNFDGEFSNNVRSFFIQNMLFWFKKYHLDGLRLDSTFAMIDDSAIHILKELSLTAQQLSKETARPYFLFAENGLNEIKLFKKYDNEGYGLNGQWNDDFHHTLHSVLTGEKNGYYGAYTDVALFQKILKSGFAYYWHYAADDNRRYGDEARELSGEQLIVFCQNHDQVGNRMNGERLSQLISFDALKLAAAFVLMSPNIPMLFMGEEYGEDNPFLYFIDHSDEKLIEQVRDGRKREFEAFQSKGEPADPQDIITFLKSKIDWTKRHSGLHEILLKYYKKLISLRKEISALYSCSKEQLEVYRYEKTSLIVVKRWCGSECFLMLFNFGKEEVNWFGHENGALVFDSFNQEWGGNTPTTKNELIHGESLPIKGFQFLIYQL